MSELPQKEIKALMKEAMKEWLDEKFTLFGKFSAGTVACLALAALTYFILYMNGWKIG
jgi:hypothetical protein